jgi:hypothetical protein
MKRREFTFSLGAAAVLTACGGGGGGGSSSGGSDTGAPGAATTPESGPTATALAFGIGTNLASMELTDAVRYGASTLPNVNFSVPREQDVKYLRDSGFRKSRLPIRWEMLQPVLASSRPNAATRAILGNPGEFHPGYAAMITQVLDAHANAGTKCIIDVHNYCRYTDFVYQPDGSVIGLTKPNSVAQPFTTDPTQVIVRIMALADGATLTIADYVDFMTRLANTWKGHPGLGGWGLMNEPYAMPKPGETLPNDPNLPSIYMGQDLTIWPTFAAAAVKAIRAIDADTLIYLGGNNWSNAWGLGTDNPGWPLDAANIVYEVHCYLDATNSGQGANWDIQAASNFSVGVSDTAPIDTTTGAKRLQQALDFAVPRKMALALTETGMPTDDPRWQQSWENMVQLAKANNVEVYSWAGGSHWQNRAAHLNNIPTWYQNRPVQSQVAGSMMAVAQTWQATIFDAGTGWSQGGGPVVVTVYARGALQNAVTLTVSSDNGGTFSKTTLIIPAGANGSDTFTFTPAPNSVTTLTYTSSSAPNVPPPRKVYSLTDPVAYAATNLTDAAMALLAKYSAAKWDMADGYTDPLYGTPSADGEALRAVSDTGYGSRVGDELEMLNWFNTATGMGPFTTPVMRIRNSRKSADLTDPNVFGLWCRKRLPIPLTSSTTFTADPAPVEVVPYGLNSPQFAIAAISVPSATTGLVFQAGSADGAHYSALAVEAGKPQARWVDTSGNVVQSLTGSTTLQANQPTTVSFISDGNTQTLRVGSAATAGAAALPAATFDQMLLGSGFTGDYPLQSFGGYLFAAITGTGTPSADEMGVLESYLMQGMS